MLTTGEFAVLGRPAMNARQPLTRDKLMNPPVAASGMRWSVPST